MRPTPRKPNAIATIFPFFSLKLKIFQRSSLFSLVVVVVVVVFGRIGFYGVSVGFFTGSNWTFTRLAAFSFSLLLGFYLFFTFFRSIFTAFSPPPPLCSIAILLGFPPYLFFRFRLIWGITGFLPSFTFLKAMVNATETANVPKSVTRFVVSISIFPFVAVFFSVIFFSVAPLLIFFYSRSISISRNDRAAPFRKHRPPGSGMRRNCSLFLFSLSLFFLHSFLTVSSFSSFRSFVFSVGIPKYSEHVLTEFYPMAVAILSRFFL